MYSWIWGKLPGGRVQKFVAVAVLLAAITLLMYIVVFPSLEQLIGIDEVAVTE